MEEIKHRLLPLGMSRLRSTPMYEWLVQLEESPETVRHLRSARRQELQRTLRRSFAEVLQVLRKEFGRLTPEDQMYCILVLNGYSVSTIAEVTGSTYEALKTRKSRLKAKIPAECFEFLFLQSDSLKIKDLK